MDLKPLKIAIITAAAIMGFALLGATGVVAKTFYKVRSLGNTIAVTGSAERTVRSDVVKWTARISDSSSLGDLNNASVRVKENTDRTVKLLKEGGLADNELTVRPLSVYPIYGDPEGRFGGSTQIVGHTLEQTLVVESKAVDKVTQLVQTVSARLLAEGIVFSTDSLEYYVSSLSDLKLEMLEEATQNSKDRADRIVRSTGSSLGPLQTAGVGVFQVTALNSTEISDYGAYDTSTIDKKVTAVVRTSFLVR